MSFVLWLVSCLFACQINALSNLHPQPPNHHHRRGSPGSVVRAAAAAARSSRTPHHLESPSLTLKQKAGSMADTSSSNHALGSAYNAVDLGKKLAGLDALVTQVEQPLHQDRFQKVQVKLIDFRSQAATMPCMKSRRQDGVRQEL